MLNKIFNRKYLKAIEVIEEEIELLRGQEDYYKAELRMGLDYNGARGAVSLAEFYENRRKELENVLREIKRKLN